MQNEDVLDHDGQKARADAMERTVMQMLGQTRYGDCRKPYRNGKTGKLSFPVLSEREMEART